MLVWFVYQRIALFYGPVLLSQKQQIALFLRLFLLRLRQIYAGDYARGRGGELSENWRGLAG